MAGPSPLEILNMLQVIEMAEKKEGASSCGFNMMWRASLVCVIAWRFWITKA
ncbi:MAG: hypothetical protein ACOWYE_15920 [Desulfatiglandales bacterium]